MASMMILTTVTLQAKVDEEDNGMVEMIQTSQERIADTLDNTLGKVNGVLFQSSFWSSFWRWGRFSTVFITA